MLRLPIGVVSTVAMLVAQTPPGFAENAASAPARPTAFNSAQDVIPSPAIVDAFMAFPKGGDLLSERIADIIAKDPKLAVAVANYVQTAPGLSKDQKLAALRGLAAGLNRLGIKAADMPVKGPPPPPGAPVPPPAAGDAWLVVGALAAIAGLICLGACQQNDDGTTVGMPVVRLARSGRAPAMIETSVADYPADVDGAGNIVGDYLKRRGGRNLPGIRPT